MIIVKIFLLLHEGMVYHKGLSAKEIMCALLEYIKRLAISINNKQQLCIGK